MELTYAEYLVALAQIIGINILLSGDNAVVIALAARNLPARARKLAIIGGTAAAVVMRIVFTTVVVYLMRIAYLKLIGSAMLFWIAIKLLIPEAGMEAGETGDIDAKQASSTIKAIGTIMIADAVMSLDNVIGIAAAARDSFPLIVIGLAISIPLVVYGSTIVLKLLDRFPWLVTAGGALLGWVAGEIAIDDPAMAEWAAPYMPYLHYAAAVAGAIVVVVVGTILARRATRRGQAASY